ncbi:hypothetical protein BHE16_04195 [Neomicrococcus aestuarii]|uniref:Cell wall-binding repeat 2 family protein n=1 Tax=Neomicrococcus aestuarii TaxID=556325 RepID=A0A1L2ZRW5_9MICC|nr:hypothetical protein BHE16_04195 [Neomicrococcus aestuarii]
MVARKSVLLTSIALVAALGISGCTGGIDETSEKQNQTQSQLSRDHHVTAAGAMTQKPSAAFSSVNSKGSAASIAASKAVFASSPKVYVARSSQADAVVILAAEAARQGAPMLLLDSSSAAQKALETEIQRLKATEIILPENSNLSDAEKALFGDVSVNEVAIAQDTSSASAPASAATGPDGFIIFTTAASRQEVGTAAALGSLQGAGGTLVELESADPRATSGTIEAIKNVGDKHAIAVGTDFASSEEFAGLAESATAGVELPGGGQVVFPFRRFVALYGHPGTGALGLLGEQGPEESVARVKELAAEYQPFSTEPVQPAFEIITTIASAAPGADGQYSSVTPISKLMPYIDAAEKAGVYVVLDLQPGRNDFLTQAKLYEELLKKPHVGLALDPEWRLGPGQKHMVQIGSVEAAEVNEVSDWLATLTRENKLPQKIFVLHQFRKSMIKDRDQVKADHPELATVLHADGNGGRESKFATWNALRKDLPDGIWLAWKNFIDEDSPTFTPEETFETVTPKPWFVSYQ